MENDLRGLINYAKAQMNWFKHEAKLAREEKDIAKDRRASYIATIHEQYLNKLNDILLSKFNED